MSKLLDKCTRRSSGKLDGDCGGRDAQVSKECIDDAGGGRHGVGAQSVQVESGSVEKQARVRCT